MEKAIRQSSKIIVPSISIKNDLIENFSLSESLVEVIAHGNSLPKGIIKSPHKPYFLSVGTIEPRKNLDFYAQAIRQSGLQKDFDFIHVGRIGWGKIPSELEHKTNTSDQELANYIANATAVVIPSEYEGFGLPVLEAHFQNTPVILSNDAALKELALPIDSVFQLGDIEHLIEALRIKSQNLSKFTEKDFRDCLNLTWDRSALQHANLYREFL